MTDSTKEITVQADLATMHMRIQKEGAEDRVFEIDVVQLALLGGPTEKAHGLDENTEDWQPSPEFIADLAKLYNENDVLQGMVIVPSVAYAIYFEMLDRWVALKKNMSFMPTSPNSTEGTSETGDTNKEQDSSPT